MNKDTLVGRGDKLIDRPYLGANLQSYVRFVPNVCETTPFLTFKTGA